MCFQNLVVDEYLQFAMAATPDEWIKLNTLCSFNRMKKLKANVKRAALFPADTRTRFVIE